MECTKQVGGLVHMTDAEITLALDDIKVEISNVELDDIVVDVSAVDLSDETEEEADDTDEDEDVEQQAT